MNGMHSVHEWPRRVARSPPFESNEPPDCELPPPVSLVSLDFCVHGPVRLYSPLDVDVDVDVNVPLLAPVLTSPYRTYAPFAVRSQADGSDPNPPSMSWPFTRHENTCACTRSLKPLRHRRLTSPFFLSSSKRAVPVETLRACVFHNTTTWSHRGSRYQCIKPLTRHTPLRVYWSILPDQVVGEWSKGATA